MEHTSASDRVQSIDALRGFDMFWISGGDIFFHALAATTAWHWAAMVSRQMSHSVWAGCTWYDLIQPLFLFITGITLPLSVSRRLARGQSRWEILRRLAFRAVVLIILGQFDKNGPLSFDVAHIRFAGVLQRIGVGGFAAGVIMMYCRPRAQALWAAGILIAYWALLTFVPVPGQPAPSYARGANLVDYLDQHIMPGRLIAGNHDGEGWFSTPPAVASVLCGALAGGWLLSAASVRRKVTRLVGVGLALVLLGWLWGLQFPIIKNLFTSSYVVYAAGWSCLLLGLFYGVIDGLGWRRWSFPFVLIGMNPLVIYLLLRTGWVNLPYITQYLLGFSFSHMPQQPWRTEIAVGYVFPNVVVSGSPVWQIVATIGVEFALLYWLYRKKIFWRI